MEHGGSLHSLYCKDFMSFPSTTLREEKHIQGGSNNSMQHKHKQTGLTHTHTAAYKDISRGQSIEHRVLSSILTSVLKTLQPRGQCN